MPPRSVLVAVDFSDSSRLALVFGARLAARTGATLTVLHVEDPLLAAAARAEGIALSDETQTELTAFVASAAADAGTTRLHDIVAGDAAKTICLVAQRAQVDLIVLGVRGMSGAEHTLFGSTTEGVLRHASVSVLAVPDTWAPVGTDGVTPTPIGPLIAAVDFSPESEAAARAACTLAFALSTAVELWHVVPERRSLLRWQRHSEAAVREHEAAATRELASLAGRLSSDAPIEQHVTSGRVAERLAEMAAPLAGRWPLVVMGRRRYADRDGAPGSIAYRLLTRSSAPTLLYIAPAAT